VKYNHLKDERFYEIMALLAEQSDQDTNDFKDRIYAEGLSDFSIEQIQQTIWPLIKTRKFSSFPKIAEIIEFMSGSTEDHAQVQAAIVWQSIIKYGATRSVVFDDAITMAVIQQGFGGWIKLCSETMLDQQQWFIKDFARHYGAFKRSGVNHYGILPGWADSDKGPALIGNQQKALQIMEQGKETPMIAGFSVSQLADKMGI